MDSKRTLLPALLAVSSGVAATDAAALELGEINVHSALGQPLRASVAFALRPNESLADYCVSVVSGGQASGLPSLQSVNVGVADGVIRFTSRAAVNEPMSSLRVDVNCPYTPHLVRDYVVFLDPVGVATTAVAAAPAVEAPAPVAANRPAPVAANRPARPPAPAPARRPAAAAPTAPPLATGERYRVQPGDTLSEIAQRIEGRSVSLWTAVGAIFDANPGAFIDDDPNLLKAGTWIVIPDSARGGAAAPSVASSTAVSVAEAPAAEAPAPTAEAATATYDLVEEPAIEEPVAMDDTAVLEPARNAASADASQPADPQPLPVADDTVDLSPGDVVLDVQPEPLGTPAAEPAVAPLADDGGSSWGWWIAGGGLMLLGGLVAFSRRRIAPTPPPAEPVEETVIKPKRYLEEAPKVEVVESPTIETETAPRYDIGDDSPTEENLVIDALVVDADLEHGTGLHPAVDVDVDVSEDFSFASNEGLSLDLEFPDDAGADDDAEYDESLIDTVETAVNIDEDAIPESEHEDDDEYDMSVVVDATSVRDDTAITERDLRAVVVGGAGDEPPSDNYTVSQEVDYKILAQNYEDELTATQALNAEIERAAAELADRMDDDAADSGRTTAQMATVTRIDAAATDDDTIEAIDDDTAEIPLASADDDATAEMPIKRSKGS